MSRLRVLAAFGVAAVSVLVAVAGHDGLASCLAAAILGGILLWHQQLPRAGAVLVAGTLLVSLTFVQLAPVVVTLVGLNAYAVARYCTRPVALVTGLLMLAGAEVSADADSSAPYLFIVLGPLLAGWALRQRDVIAAELADRAAELDAEREIYSELSVRYERARIAAELHDIVAHAVSVIVVQASAGQRLATMNPDLTEEAFAAIGVAARHAEADMGRLVALLTDTETTEDADLLLVRELVERATATGLDVNLRLEGDRSMAPTWAYRDAYLVVREGLTNALRYASGAPVDVLVRGQPHALLVTVTNGQAPHSAPLVGQGSGRGLQGLRERLDTHGGQLTAGPTPDRGWQLQVTLPQRDLTPTTGPPGQGRYGRTRTAL